MKKITKLLFLLATMIILCVMVGVSASAAYYNYTYEIFNGEVDIIGYKGKGGCVVIPSEFDGYPVKTISEFAFSDCDSLTNIIIPDSVITILDEAFADCDKLTSITIPASVTSIDPFTFSPCGSLRDIYYSGSEDDLSIEYWDEDDMKYVHMSMKDYIDIYGPITDATIHFNSTGIKMYGSFEYVIQNNEIIIVGYKGDGSAGVIPTEIDGYPVTTIGEYAFYSCDNLTNIEIPDTVTSIGSNAFYHTGYYNDEANWENGVLYISKHLIDTEHWFSGIYTINASTKTIADHAFYNSLGLRSVEIPDSVINIGYSAFYDCYSLKDVYYGGSEEKWNNIDIGELNDELIDATIHFNLKAPHTHAYNSKVTKSAGCTTTGIKTFTCSCGDTYTETIKVAGHKEVTDKAIPSTCSKTGLTEGSHCSVCKTVIKKQNVTTKKAHAYKAFTTKATLKKNGKVTEKCTVCGYVSKTTVINKIKSVKLSVTEYTYNGKAKTPSVTAKNSKGKTLKKGIDYTVTYPKKRKSVGKYTVTVTFKGNYSGTKKLTFEIVPAKVTLSKLTAGKKQLTATWKTVSGATGYEVVYSTSKKFTKKTTKTVTIKKVKTKKTTIKKLKKGKKYYVKVRAYKTVSGKKIYGAYSAVKSVKVK